MTEAAIQAAVFQHLAVRGAPGVFAFHPANGGYRNPIEAKRLKGQGVVPGVPDIVIAARGKTFGLELKTTKGRLSPHQRAAIEALRGAGWECFVAFGLDEAIQFLEFHGLVRGVS